MTRPRSLPPLIVLAEDLSPGLATGRRGLALVPRSRPEPAPIERVEPARDERNAA